MSNNLWKTAGLIGIGYILKDFTDYLKYRYRLKNLLIPKISYNKEYPMKKRKSYTLYQDFWLSSEEACKTFKDLITDLYNEQGGYITTLQYMAKAGFETSPDQDNYGWTSLDGFKYEQRKDGWLVTMPYPVPFS